MFVSDSTLPVLVNRGWVKANKDRRVLPKLPLSEESITLHGVIKREPVTGMLLAENTDERIAGVIRVQHIDINEINKNYGLNLPGFIVRLSEDSDAGLLRDWPKPGSGRDKHLGYAFQWFAMATAVLVIFIVVNFKTKE